MKRAFILSFFLSLLATGLAEDEKPCTTHVKGKFYDLNPLRSNKDHEVVGLASKPLFPINVCQSVRTEPFGVKDDIKHGDIAAFMRRGHGDFVIGKVNTTLDFYENHPRMILSSGSRCKSDRGEAQDIRASTVIDFVCDPSVFSTGQPRLVAALPPGKEDEACAFVIEWRTQYACPTSEGGIVWSIFVTIAVTFLSLLLAYTILGTLYNRFVLQLRGFDQIPQFSIESMKYHASEGIDWAKDLYAIYGPGSGNSPFGVPSSGLNPVSHQATVGRPDLEAGGGQDSPMGTKAFARTPMPRTPVSANRSSAFTRAPQRPETNPVSHQSQVNAELEHQRVLSLSQRSPIPSQASSATSTHLSFEHSPTASTHNAAPLVSVSPSLPEQPLPPVPTKSTPTPPAPVAQPAVVPSGSSSSQPAKADKDSAVSKEGSDEEDDDDDEEEGSDEESEEEQDYSEYNDADPNSGAKELSDFKRPAPGGSSSSR